MACGENELLRDDTLRFAERAAAAGVCALMVSGVGFRFKDIMIKALDVRHDSTMQVGGQSVSDQPMSFLVSTAAGTRVMCGGDFSLSADLKNVASAVLSADPCWAPAVCGQGPSPSPSCPPAARRSLPPGLGAPTVIPVPYSPGDTAPARLIAELAGSPRVRADMDRWPEHLTASVPPA